MENLIFTGISLLILLPIIYFLPIGFTVKGKVFIVVASFLLSLVGLGASLVFPIWQTGLILLLLVTASAYLLMKTGKQWLYLVENNQPFVFEEEKQEQPINEIKDTYSYIAFSDKSPKKSIVEKEHQSNPKQKSEPISILAKLVSDNEKDISLISKETDMSEDLDEAVIVMNDTVKTGALQKDSAKEKPVESKLDMESFIKSEEPTGEVEMPSSDEQDYSYLAEVEKLLEVDEIDFDSMKKDTILEASNEDTIELILEFDAEQNTSLGNIEEQEYLLDDEFQLEELQLDDLPNHTTDNTNNNLIKEDEDLFDLEELFFFDQDDEQEPEKETKTALEEKIVNQ
ncbi:hypothetical protein [Neobacillus sp. LXY-4]|uniref:hypothetical protein n=1 Tax=Neobacillus sp. LXY-4 TaxID=3379826 RepID=UPI003EE2E9D5